MFQNPESDTSEFSDIIDGSDISFRSGKIKVTAVTAVAEVHVVT